MALERSSKVAIAKYAWSGRERLGMLRVRDDVIVLHAMRWPDEIRDPAELTPRGRRAHRSGDRRGGTPH
ncbi:Ku protein [Streptomyces sp. NPDC058272]|uniref:Ku protein n=1 Tax=Streptomyces sp. NPDC058272 TaxID=3346415 RepID=UPI0036EA5B20